MLRILMHLLSCLLRFCSLGFFTTWFIEAKEGEEKNSAILNWTLSEQIKFEATKVSTPISSFLHLVFDMLIHSEPSSAVAPPKTLVVLFLNPLLCTSTLYQVFRHSIAKASAEQYLIPTNMPPASMRCPEHP